MLRGQVSAHCRSLKMRVMGLAVIALIAQVKNQRTSHIHVEWLEACGKHVGRSPPTDQHCCLLLADATAAATATFM